MTESEDKKFSFYCFTFKIFQTPEPEVIILLLHFNSQNKNINVDCVNYKNTNTGNYSVITEEKTMIHTGTELSLHCDTDNIQTSSGFDEDLAGKDLRENLINEHKVIDQLSEG